MSLDGRVDREVEARLNNKVISILIPLLSNLTESLENGVLISVLVILTMSEQFYELGDDAQCHLGGASTLLSASHLRWSPHHTDVSGTAFWVWVRESIRICFLNEQSCHFDTNIIDDELALSSPPDEVWTNRMTSVLLRLCNICWTERRKSERLELLEVMGNAIQ